MEDALAFPTLVSIAAGIAAALVALAAGFFAMPIGTALGLLDFPDEVGGRKRHARVTPLVGGVVLAVVGIAAVVATIVLVPDLAPGVERHLAWLGVAIGAMFVIGVADDRFELSVRARLGLAALVLLLVVATAPDFGLTFIRFAGESRLHLLGPFGVVFTLFCLVGLLNAVNMADGKNGIVVSLGLIWSVVLLVRLPAPMIPVMAATASALAVLLWFNMRNRLFLGDGGSYAVSALFGLLAIYAYNHDFATIGADDVVLMFAVPIIDTVRLVVGRSLDRRSPFSGGRDHLHHYLHARIGWPRGLWIYVALVAAPNAAAVALPGTALAWFGVTAVAYALVLRQTSKMVPSRDDTCHRNGTS